MVAWSWQHYRRFLHSRFTHFVILALDARIFCRCDTAMAYYVYFMSNRPDGTIYVGVTNDLVRRVYQHRTKAVPGFTTRYNLEKLAYFEIHETAAGAIQREKTIKHWVRAWKVALIEQDNPDWKDLFEEIAR